MSPLSSTAMSMKGMDRHQSASKDGALDPVLFTKNATVTSMGFPRPDEGFGSCAPVGIEPRQARKGAAIR